MHCWEGATQAPTNGSVPGATGVLSSTPYTRASSREPWRELLYWAEAQTKRGTAGSSILAQDAASQCLAVMGTKHKRCAWCSVGNPAAMGINGDAVGGAAPSRQAERHCFCGTSTARPALRTA